jgi:hypothetical protein
VNRTAAMKALFCSCLLGLIASSMGCGIVAASSSYNVSNLPKTPEGVYIFHGYVFDAAKPVRMQAKGTSNGTWHTVKTVSPSSSKTYVYDTNGDVDAEGHYWKIEYQLPEMTQYRNGTALTMWIRFVTKNGQNADVVLAHSSGNVDSCYFGAREQGQSVADAANGCSNTSDIAVIFDPIPPPDPCPPPPASCNLVPGQPGESPLPGGTQSSGEGSGGGTGAE